MKLSEEERLDSLLGKKVAKQKRRSAREICIEDQDKIPVNMIVAYLDSIGERAVINDGRLVNFSR